MARKRQKRRLMAEINVVPYIDVMLVLLIIFMVTTPIMLQGVKVDLPKASAKALPPQKRKPVVVTVDARGRYYLNLAANPKRAQSASQIETQVRHLLRENPRRKVYVRGDRTVAYGKVVKAMVWLQQAGAPNVGLVTDEANHRSRH